MDLGQIRMSAGLAFAVLAASSGSAAAQQDPVTLPDAKGHIDAPKLACAQLANTCQENADFLGIWYSGWYNGLAKKPAINMPRVKQNVAVKT